MIASRDRFVAAAFILLLASSLSAQVTSDPWLILARGEKGSINVHTTRQDLVRMYGKSNVVDQDVNLGEGETETGTALFPNDPERSIEILWRDWPRMTEPKSLTIRGNNSRWRAVHDISLGTSLKELERFNGKPFHMSGYGWDYSGTVASWDQGMLAQDLGEFDPKGNEHGRIILRLTCGKAGTKPVSDEEGMQVEGDRDLASSHPVLQKMNPCVGEMVWLFSGEQ
jgi:hypothetical protein